ncbi:MAG: glycosyltransferase family 2 protein [Nitrospira defluvii]|nr:glycosyltransferase family 2 protein [Nitrospira defluvii]
MLTVMISTLNRASILARTLEAYCGLQRPEGGWELIIIDNGSQDHTRQVIESFRDQLPIVSLHESQPGKNVALNHGLCHVKGHLVVFTDDDVFPRTDWLVQYERLAWDHREYDLFGGVTLPRWEVPPPDWILDWVPLGPTFTLSPPTLTDGPSVPANTFGTNYAVRAHLFQAGCRFDVQIGPCGTNYAMGSETQLIQTLYRNGHRIWHSSDLVVEHWVEADKLNREWILKRAQRFGRGQYRLEAEGQATTHPTWGGVPRYLFRQIPEQGCRVLWARLRGRARQIFEEEWKLMYAIGNFYEARLIAKTRARGGGQTTPGAGNLSGFAA